MIPILERRTNPNFLCIGSQKAGTTWLYKNLKRHPEVWLPPVKALRYFNEAGRSPFVLKSLSPKPESTRWRHLLGKFGRRLLSMKIDEELLWYFRYLFSFRTDSYYLSLFSTAGELLSGEVTPAYCRLSDSCVAQAAELMPGAKIIYLARNPIDRMVSHAAMRYGKLGRALDEIPSAELASWFDSGPPRAYSDIAGTLDRWQRHFGTDSVFVLFFEQLKEEPQEAFSSIQRWLGIREIPLTDLGKVWNPGSYNSVKPEILEAVTARCQDLVRAAHDRFRNRFTESWVAQIDQKDLA